MPLSPKNQKTIEAYYAHTNSGDFRGALQHLSDDVVYRIPGPSELVAYAGEWKGKERVLMLFEAFRSSFGLVDMIEVRMVASDNDAVSMNDEIFTSRSTGQAWRLGVAHHMQFNSSGLICELNNYTDIGPAIQALGGKTSYFTPVLSSDFVPGESEVSSAAAEATVKKYYANFPNVDALLDDDILALAPGDQRRIRFSGTWQGKNSFRQMLQHFSGTLAVEKSDVKKMVIEGGSVAAIIEMSGQVRATRTPFTIEALDFLQVTRDEKIARITAFFDSYRITQGA